MAHGNPSPEPPRIPAIILHGEPIAAMADEQRHEVAAGLGLLLGTEVTVTSIATSLIAMEAGVDVMDPEPIESLAPFTLLADDRSRTRGFPPHFERQVLAASERSPGVIENEVLAKRALSFVERSVYRADATVGSVWPFTFHFYAYDENLRWVHAITFDDPQALMDRPQDVIASVRGLGPKTVKALAQFAAAATATR